MNNHLRRYKNRPAQTFIDSIGWVSDDKLNNPIVLSEIMRITQRRKNRKVKK